ncbi:MAG: DEAD/DEAH box helicase [Nitrososphaerota archaeon]|nr:DEAD/DEAH box helicase [Nitrososphaerota archaeon]
MRFDELQIPPDLLKFVQSKGFAELYPPQEAAVKSGLLDGKNLVISSPTASGKTLIAILAAYAKVKAGRKVVYLAPLRALASEKYGEFSELAGLGVRTAISTGDYDRSGESLGKADIIVLTNERFDSVMRHNVSWLHSVGLFIADEVHLAGSDSRGPTLEMILTKVMHAGLDAQILSLSATISNAKEVSGWLKSEPIEVDWRPVPLKQGVYDYGKVVFTDGDSRKVPTSTYGAPIDVAMEAVRGGGQSLIFANTRRRAVSLATRAAEVASGFASAEEKRALSEAARRILASGEETSLSRLLAEVVAKGAAFHHAGLEPEHRRIVEDYYRARAIKVLAATPTLCLPAGEEIFGNPEPIAIEKLAKDDRVLTHGNVFEKVIGPTSRRYDGVLLKVTPWSQLPMRMTPEHKVLRATRTRHSIHARGTNRHWWSYSIPEWTESRNLRVGDLVLFPRMKEMHDIKRLELPAPGPLSNQYGIAGKHWSRLRSEQLELDAATLESFGLYLAEGYSGKQGQVMFAVSTREKALTSLLVRWLKSLGLRPRVTDSDRHRRVIRACSKQLSKLLREMCGPNAAERRIPRELMLLPNDKIAHVVRGVWRGDGGVTGGEARTARYSTVSRSLAKQLFAVLVKMGYMPAVRVSHRAGKMASNGLDITHGHDLYTVSVSGEQLDRFLEEVLHVKPRRFAGNREYNIGHVDSDYYYMPIRKIELERYHGTVHNLEVEGHSSYVGSFVVHNSAGVNLPARRVVIADISRYDVESGGNAEISVLEYRQMAGRAGRPQYDEYGETVLVPPSAAPAMQVLDHFAREPPEPIKSRLADEGAMRVHTLATIASSAGLSKLDVQSLFGRTLLSMQIGPQRVGRLIDSGLGYLLAERLVESRGTLFHATDFGKRVSMLYIDPITGVQFREAIRKMQPGKSYTAGLLHVVSSSPDFEPKFPLRSKDYDAASAFMEEHSGEFVEKPSRNSFADFDEVLQGTRSVMALYGWIDEWKEEQLLSKLGVEPGDMHRAVDNADWLLHSMGELAKLFKRDETARQVERLRRRVESGVSDELIELTSLQGVGRVRARALHSAGFRTIEDLKEASADRIALVEKVGTSVARRIKEQVARY